MAAQKAARPAQGFLAKRPLAGPGQGNQLSPSPVKSKERSSRPIAITGAAHFAARAVELALRTIFVCSRGSASAGFGYLCNSICKAHEPEESRRVITAEATVAADPGLLTANEAWCQLAGKSVPKRTYRILPQE